MKLRHLFALSAAAMVPAGALAADPQVDLRTNLGTIRLELYPAKAPKTMRRIGPPAMASSQRTQDGASQRVISGCWRIAAVAAASASRAE